jgi:hypothetical protein
MPLNDRAISISIAVMCFFGVSVVSSIGGVSSFACCKRAIAAAVVMYIATSLVVKIINAILISAMVNSQINKQKESADGSGN